jgi:nitroreductase
LGKQNAAAFEGRISTSTAYISKEQPSIADDPSIGDGFYGAPTVMTLFAPKGFLYSEMDCSLMAENMILAAHSLGVGSCFIGRAVETFACDLGQEVLRKWEIPTNHRAFLHVVLGYPASQKPVHTKPRKEGRVRRI